MVDKPAVNILYRDMERVIDRRLPGAARAVPRALSNRASTRQNPEERNRKQWSFRRHAAALVPAKYPSADIVPPNGIARWVCASIAPGSTNLSFASTTSAPAVGSILSSVSVIFPFVTAISALYIPPEDTSVPFFMRRSIYYHPFVRLWRAAGVLPAAISLLVYLVDEIKSGSLIYLRHLDKLHAAGVRGDQVRYPCDAEIDSAVRDSRSLADVAAAGDDFDLKSDVLIVALRRRDVVAP